MFSRIRVPISVTPHKYLVCRHLCHAATFPCLTSTYHGKQKGSSLVNAEPVKNLLNTGLAIFKGKQMFERGKKDKFDQDGLDASGTSNQPRSSAREAASTSHSRASGSSEIAVIGRSIRIDGDLSGEEDLRIDGDVTGTVQLRNNTLTIGSEGKINANVYAKSVTVDGIMNGDVYGSERVTVRKNAQVDGNITAPRVSLEDGAKFKGSIEMDPAKVEKALGKNAAAATNIASQSNGEKRIPKPITQSNKSGVKNESLS